MLSGYHDSDKYNIQGGVFWTAGIEAKGDFSFSFKEVTDPNLMESHPVFGAFDAKIIQPSAEPVPHGFYFCRDFCGRPV